MKDNNEVKFEAAMTWVLLDASTTYTDKVNVCMYTQYFASDLDRSISSTVPIQCVLNMLHVLVNIRDRVNLLELAEVIFNMVDWGNVIDMVYE